MKKTERAVDLQDITTDGEKQADEEKWGEIREDQGGEKDGNQK